MKFCTALSNAAALTLALGTLASCGGLVAYDEPPDTTSAAGGGAEPKTCELTQGPIELVAAPDNAQGCEATMRCEVWFGHGQHLSCPELGSRDPEYAECTVWDCVCTRYEEPDFVADFSTGEVVDTRVPGLVCRYRLVSAQAG